VCRVSARLTPAGVRPETGPTLPVRPSAAVRLGDEYSYNKYSPAAHKGERARASERAVIGKKRAVGGMGSHACKSALGAALAIIFACPAADCERK